MVRVWVLGFGDHPNENYFIMTQIKGASLLVENKKRWKFLKTVWISKQKRKLCIICIATLLLHVRRDREQIFINKGPLLKNTAQLFGTNARIQCQRIQSQHFVTFYCYLLIIYSKYKQLRYILLSKKTNISKMMIRMKPIVSE